jgi:hypothetical protein
MIERRSRPAMTDSARQDSVPASSQPPVEPALYDSSVLAEPPGWPKVVGWISVVWGVIGLGCLGCGVLGAMMPAMFPEGIAQQFPDGFPDAIASPPMSSFVIWGFSGVVSVFLIVAGSMLIMRKRIAWQLHIAYAIIGMLLAGVSVWLGVQQQQAITDWCNQNPGSKFAESQKANGMVSNVIMVVAILMGFAWPVFCGVWFGVLKRDASEIDRGKQAVV